MRCFSSASSLAIALLTTAMLGACAPMPSPDKTQSTPHEDIGPVTVIDIPPEGMDLMNRSVLPQTTVIPPLDLSERKRAANREPLP
jgi:hypothetical protein